MAGQRRNNSTVSLISAEVNRLPHGECAEIVLHGPAVVQRASNLSSTPHAPRLHYIVTGY